MRHTFLECGLVVIGCATVSVALAQDGTLTDTPRAREAFLAYRKQEPPAAPSSSTRQTPTAPGRGQTAATVSASASTGNSTGRVAAAPDPETAPLALRFKILQEIPAGNGFEEVDGDKIFSSGDHIRMVLTVNQPVYVYVAQRGTSGKWEVLYPSANSSASNYISNGYEDIQLPQGDRAWNFKGDPGMEHLFVAVSRQKIADLQESVEKASPAEVRPLQPGTRPNNEPSTQFAKSQFKEDVVTRLLRSRDLDFHKYDSPAGGLVEHAVYFANENNPTAPVVAEFKLRHQP
jgi:hypothetical protein